MNDLELNVYPYRICRRISQLNLREAALRGSLPFQLTVTESM